MLGLPENWQVVEGWIDSSHDVPEVGEPVPCKFGVKNLEIPVLGNYAGKGNQKFWDSFPSHYPTSIC
jgi:hypothetical protein